MKLSILSGILFAVCIGKAILAMLVVLLCCPESCCDGAVEVQVK